MSDPPMSVRYPPPHQVQVLAGLFGKRGLPTIGPATASKLHSPTGLAVDGVGSIYIADPGAGVIERITPDGTLQVLAGQPGRYWPPVQGRATRRYLHHPSGVAADSSGNVYVADASSAAIAMITPGGMLLRLAGQLRHRTQVLRSAPMPGPAQMSPLYSPCSIAIDQAGNTLTVDPYSGVIVRITPDRLLSLAADIPNEPWISMPATVWAFEAELEGKQEPLSDPPIGIAVDATNTIYVADSYNAVVQKLVPLPPAGNQTDQA